MIRELHSTSGAYQRNVERAARWLAREIGVEGLSDSLQVQLIQSTRSGVKSDGEQE